MERKQIKMITKESEGLVLLLGEDDGEDDDEDDEYKNRDANADPFTGVFLVESSGL